MRAVPVRDCETEGGGVEVGGARLLGFMTRRGDGFFPGDETQGELVTVRIAHARCQTLHLRGCARPVGGG